MSARLEDSDARTSCTSFPKSRVSICVIELGGMESGGKGFRQYSFRRRKGHFAQIARDRGCAHANLLIRLARQFRAPSFRFFFNFSSHVSFVSSITTLDTLSSLYLVKFESHAAACIFIRRGERAIMSQRTLSLSLSKSKVK